VTAFIKRSDSPEPSSGLPFLIGVAGGSGSGKTYFSSALKQILGHQACEVVYQDNFYIDQSHRFDFDGGSVNFDHPDSIDFERLAECLAELKRGKPTAIPVYDFVTHKRQDKPLLIEPRPVIIVDGILILHSEPVRKIFDHKVFFDTTEELRFARRLARDVNERGRSPEGVKNQFVNQVKPMHEAFVDPSKTHADHVILDNGNFQEILDGYHQKLRNL
jgi:uridine kinase